jgi:surfeit locus 1 family protein
VKLRIRPWPALLVLVVIAVTVRLGFWQLDRAHQKEATAARIANLASAAPETVDARRVPLAAIEYHRVRAHGRFLADRVVYLDNRPHGEQPGFYVVMPLQLDSGASVLVLRGWLPLNPVERTAMAPYATPSGPVEVTGIARADATRAFELGHGAAPHAAIRQNLEIAAYARETGLSLQPFVIEQTGGAADGLLRDWPAPTLGVERNYGYALQWWLMALAAAGLGLYAARRAAKRAGGGDAG